MSAGSVQSAMEWVQRRKLIKSLRGKMLEVMRLLSLLRQFDLYLSGPRSASLDLGSLASFNKSIPSSQKSVNVLTMTRSNQIHFHFLRKM